MPCRPRTPGEQAGSQAGLLLRRSSLALDSWIQPKLDAGFEALALHETTTDPALATETRKAVLALAREVNLCPSHSPSPINPQPKPKPNQVNASNPAYMFKAYYRQLVMPTADEVALPPPQPRPRPQPQPQPQP